MRHYQVNAVYFIGLIFGVVGLINPIIGTSECPSLKYAHPSVSWRTSVKFPGIVSSPKPFGIATSNFAGA